MQKTVTIATVILLAGCSSLPICGTPEAQGQVCTTGWAGFFRDLAEIQSYQPQPRPFYVPPAQPAQPTFGPAAQDQYQVILVNTPSGLVYKSCKVLNGQVVACL